MVDWTILSPTFLTAAVKWAGAVVTVLAVGAGHGFFRTEGACCTSQQHLRSTEITELSHRDAPKRESGCVVAQGDPLQCSQRITRRERTCRRGYQ